MVLSWSERHRVITRVHHSLFIPEVYEPWFCNTYKSLPTEVFQRSYPCNHIWAPKFKKLIPKTRQLWIDWLFSFSLPFSSQWFKTYLQHFCPSELLLGILWLFLPFITEISLFQTSSWVPVLLRLCLLQWIQWDRAKGLSTSPWLPLTFGCQQTPGSSADGCLWACLHCLGMASKCQEPFSHTRGNL